VIKKIDMYPNVKIYPISEIIFDDGDVTIMYGHYKKDPNISMGMRWNIGESRLGYPNNYGKAMWMVVPPIIAVLILEGLIKKFTGNIPDDFNIEVANKCLTSLNNQK
jgi:hypothetical protein